MLSHTFRCGVWEDRFYSGCAYLNRHDQGVGCRKKGKKVISIKIVLLESVQEQ